jgi:hypoxanthine phosphoribosyltransferase
MSETRQYLAPGWDRVYEMLLEMALRIQRSGFHPELIVGVSRGGWAPGRILSDLLENAHTANLKIEFYTGLGKTSRKPIVTQPITEDITHKNILVVDDVSDTGESLLLALDHVREKNPGQVRTATVFYKPHSKLKPDYFAGETSDWIIFPWERLEATKLLIDEAKAKGKGLDSVRRILERCNFDSKTIDLLFQLSNGGS